jgi:hypothetical protein
MKQSLIFVLIAVLSAGLVFVGCSSDSGGGGGTAAPGIDGIVIDATVDSQEGLKEALRPDNNFEAIALVLSAGDMTLTDVVVIPQGKTLVLLNTDTSRRSLTPSTSGLNIRGSVIVSENTELYVDDEHQVSIWSSGNIQVQARGLLSTDTRISVSNYTDAGVSYESVLTTNVVYKGGSTLTIDQEVLPITEIGALLGYINSGTRAAGTPTGPSNLILGAVQNVKPSDISTIAGINENRTLTIKAGIAETAAALTIPAGAKVTAVEPVVTVTSLEVNGGLTVPAASFEELTKITVTSGATLDAATNTLPKLTELTVSGTLTAPAATGDTTTGVVLKVEKGGSATLGKITKVNEGSKVSNGGNLKAEELPATGLTTEPGAKINDELIKTEGGYETIDTIASFEEGKTYVLKAKSTGEPLKTISMSTAITLPVGAALVIPEGLTLEVANGGAFTVAGSIKVAGKLDVKGTIVTNGTIEVTGEYSTASVTADSAGTINGTVTIKAGGKISGAAGGKGKVDGDGFFVVEAGARAYIGEVIWIGVPSDAALFTLDPNAQFSFNDRIYVLEGNGTFKGFQGGYGSNGQQNIYGSWINASKQLRINYGATLTVFEDSNQRILGIGSREDNTFGVVAGSGTGALPKIVVTGSKTSIETGTENPQNFYPQITQTIEQKTYYGPYQGTFVWNTNAGGTGIAGWLKQE